MILNNPAHCCGMWCGKARRGIPVLSGVSWSVPCEILGNLSYRSEGHNSKTWPSFLVSSLSARSRHL